jgi:hypothetical protein
MKLALNSELWGTIYFNLREEFYRLHGHAQNRNEIREFLEEYGIQITTDIDERWESVEIVLDEEELTLFLLTWA